MKIDISQIDKNLQTLTAFEEKDMKLYDVRKEPFKVYGLYNYKAEKVFKRMPDDVAQATSEGVSILNYYTAGGRVRFTTTSKYIALVAKMPWVCPLSHMTLIGTSGFDLYVNRNGTDIFYKSFFPPVGMQDGYESIIYFPDNSKKDITINFPLYNNLDEIGRAHV